MQNKIHKVHTGLFLDRQKCHQLPDFVENLQDSRYRLVAAAGPQLPPLGINLLSGNIADAQVLLLATYHNMEKDFRRKKHIQKEPELIDLESSEDEAMEEDSVIILDVYKPDISSKGQNSNVEISKSPNLFDADSTIDSYDGQNSPCEPSSSTSLSVTTSKDLQGIESVAAIVNLIDLDVTNDDSVEKTISLPKSQSSNNKESDVSTFFRGNEKQNTSVINFADSDIIVINSVKENTLLKSPHLNNDTGDVLKDSNKQVKKRKLGIEKENTKDIEVVEILDDDVIVLDSNCLSASNPKKAHRRLSELDISVIEPSEVNNTIQTLSLSENPSSSSTSSRSNHFSQLHHPDTSQFTSVCQTVTKSSENKCEISDEVKTQTSGPPKKKSKLAYHRPAHLLTPLTKATPDVPSTKMDSASNIYNPNANASEKRTGLRPIVIDGNNVGIGHGKGTFSLKGIQICVNFFEKRGHRQIKVFMPHYRKNRNNHDEMVKMERSGLLVVTPSRKVNGKIVASYDDRYIVQYAAEFGGVIVSTDNFRDLMNENSSWKETIEKRLLMFTWADDLLMFPQDPLGRNGPSLDDFLKFPDD